MRFTSMTAPQIADLFATATTMVRLERLPAYGTIPSRPSYDLTEWCESVRTWTEQGCTVQRVRVLTDPVTDFMRYQLEHVYPALMEAGEDVRVLVETATAPPSTLTRQDFWLIDNATLLLLDHSRDGRLVFVDLVDDSALIGQARAIADRALGAAVPVTEDGPDQP